MSMIARMVRWTVVGIAGWFGYQLIVQHGRLLLRIEALEQQVAQLTGSAPNDTDQTNGLAVGSVVLDFALPTLSGGTMTLSQWRGQRMLLIFFDPKCRFCQQMLPDLAKLDPVPTDGRPVPLIISTGDIEQNRRLMDEHGVRCAVLLQERDEVAQLYQVDGTPMGYVIDEDGATLSPLLVGSLALLTLAVAPPAVAAVTRDSSSGQRQYTPRWLNGSTASRINRNGLRAGTPAPRFRLPCVGGGEVALEEYLGRNVLLVFSDPLCGPCNDLAPRLEQVHRQSPELLVLMISRGDLEENRAKTAEYRLTFPVALQRHWEVSRDYGMFATPIGYLIDARGIIAKDVAVGSDAILALVSGVAHRTNGTKEVNMRR